MANMSYCMFENTLPDLNDCYESLANQDFENLSKSERKNALKLIKMCRDLADDFEHLI